MGKETFYAQDEAHKEEILAWLPANRKPEIDRFKGLGEMNGDQLKETTLDPAPTDAVAGGHRKPIDADTTFHQLLGKDASERYRIIMDEATFADDLDL